MKLESEEAPNTLKPFINRYLFIEATEEEMPEVKVLPTGYSYLTYIYGEPSFFTDARTHDQLPQIFIGGQITGKGIVLKPKSEFRHLGIEFQPAGLHALLGVDMSQTTDTFLDFTQAVVPEEVTKFKRCLKRATGFDECCRELNAYFLEKARHPSDLGYVQIALDLLQKNRGDINMRDLALQSGVSSRQLRRRFSTVCGINPQKYAKILQIKNVAQLIENRHNYQLTALSYDAGFFDVSHFIKAFQKLVGENPRPYLESNDEFLQTYMQRP